MAYIYKITNDINDKIYIGKTMYSLDKRFSEHCRDAFRERNEKRPLYAAMRKYGIEHFQIEEVEETDNPEEREKYWIEWYGSFKYGYNATKGGDGKPYADYDLIVSLYNSGKFITEIAELLNYDITTCRVALEQAHITREMRKQRHDEAFYKPVIQLNKDTEEIITIFPSIGAAYRSLGKVQSGHIAAVCNGKQKTAYGYKWRYAEN